MEKSELLKMNNHPEAFLNYQINTLNPCNFMNNYLKAALGIRITFIALVMSLSELLLSIGYPNYSEFLLSIGYPNYFHRTSDEFKRIPS